MNRERRAKIDAVIKTLNTFRDAFTEIEGPDNLTDDIEAIREEEQEYFDNMPESMQGGEKGTDAEETIEQLQCAEDDLTALIDKLSDVENDIEGIIEALESAKGG